ncbi:MAG: carbohydrate kinase [bacterium]
MTKKFVIAGIGELLWDLLPDGRQLGGAPANFIYHIYKSGDDGIVISSIGNDDDGMAIIAGLEQHGINTNYIQIIPHLPTGVVNVVVDNTGQPSYEIVENVAWDNIEFTPEIAELTPKIDLICFGTLAQRSGKNKDTIKKIIETLPASTKKLYDINLRQQFYDAETVEWSLRTADIVKLNDSELLAVYHLLNINHADNFLVDSRRLANLFDIELLCVTRGEYGSLLIAEDHHDYHPGCSIEVNDTVGAGDAFTAAMAHHYLRGAPLAEINEKANRLGSFVASQSGAMPKY